MSCNRFQHWPLVVGSFIVDGRGGSSQEVAQSGFKELEMTWCRDACAVEMASATAAAVYV